jgi:hypothetical protein
VSTVLLCLTGAVSALVVIGALVALYARLGEPDADEHEDLPADTRSAIAVALDQLAAEARAAHERRRNADRLRAWRVRWWTLTGTWPDATPADVVALADRRRPTTRPTTGQEAE